MTEESLALFKLRKNKSATMDDKRKLMNVQKFYL